MPSGCPCSHDCFNCPYPDCVCGDDDIDDMTALENAEAEARDRLTERYNCEADYEIDGKTQPPEEARKRRKRAYNRSYYNKHREAELARIKAKRTENREAVNAANRKYHHENREERNRKRREYHAKHKNEINRKRAEARAAKKQETIEGGTKTHGTNGK